MASKYVLFPKAKEDLEAIFSYISIELFNPETMSEIKQVKESLFALFILTIIPLSS